MAGIREDPATSCTTSQICLATNSHGLHPEPIGSAMRFQGSSQCEKGDRVDGQLPKPGPGGGKRKGVQPHTARKLATNVAMIGALVVAPVRCLLGQLAAAPDFIEIACAPNSSLSQYMSDLGHQVQRVNFVEGYDLSRKAGTMKLKEDIIMRPPRHGWVSLACTRLTSLVHLTQRTEAEEIAFQKRQSADLKRAEEVVDGLEVILANGGNVSWEWPTKAKKGWDS